MPGPLQYGVGLQAFVINLPVAQMLSLRRAVALVQAVSGLRLFEAACLGDVRRLHDALHSRPPSPSCWNARRCMSTKPASGSSGTRSLHVVTDGTCKFLHRRRGRQAIEEIGISYTGTLDCRAAWLACDQCTHQLCGSHLLRERTFIVEATVGHA